MDAAEFKAWSNYMKSRRGKWSIDPIHDGQHRDLIAFLPNEKDETRGVYVSASGSTITAGFYEDAIPTLTDGLFKEVWGMSFLGGVKNNNHSCAKPTPEAWKLVIERLGVAFLLGAICDVPNRSSP